MITQVRRRLGTRAAGHTGTLDPFATGLLIVLVGRATRLARFLEGRPKTYLATARLGVRTATDDVTGALIGPELPGSGIPEPVLSETLHGFLGTWAQRPPSFSAKHVEGERSYRLARRGVPIELPEVNVTVHEVELVKYRPPLVTFRATVSAGTYLRGLARDLGERLGVGAHLTSLRREAIGELRVDDAVPLEAVTPAALLPARRVLEHLPALELDDEAARAVAHGRAVPGEAGGADHAALVHHGDLLAVARADGGWLRPAVVLESS